MATEARGICVKDVAANDFVVAYAAHLKRIGKIEVPKWADLVKTASYKELAPYDPDWYYIRAGAPPPPRVCAAAPPPAPRAAGSPSRLLPPPAAAIARRVYLRGGVGVGAFKKIFGGRQMRGTIREKFSTGSGSIARHILKQLEALKIVEKVPNGKGRRITPQGQRDLDSIAGQIVGEK